MKKLFLWSLCILCVIVFIPFCVGINWNKTTPTESTQTEIENSNNNKAENTTNLSISSEDEDAICCISMEYIDKNTDDETKKAILALCANNYFYNKSNNQNQNLLEISTYDDNLLTQLREIFRKGVPELFYNRNIVYIPIVKINSGYTATCDEYPYIKSIASPWDMFSDDYPPKNSEECGISVAGIEYLCKNSYNATEALRWYLPDFEMTTPDKS